MSRGNMPGPTPPLDPKGSERRARVRFPLARESYCQPGAGLLDGFWWVAKIRDISQTGLGLVVPRRFDAETLLTVELLTPNPEETLTLQVRVVHALQQEDGSWALGCTLEEELSEEKLRLLVS